MWRLSDRILKEFYEKLDETLKTLEEVVDKIDKKWLELPNPIKCKAYGVDGSKGCEKFSGVIVYAISSVAVGDDIVELHDVTTLKPYKHVEDRIRLHMSLLELRTGAMIEDADLILLDGTLSGFMMRLPVYVEKKNLENFYEIENLLKDFLELLELWWHEIERDTKAGRGRRETLLSRSNYFNRIERSYRINDERGDKENLVVFLEYIEYLHALNKLLERDVVSVAKTFYTNELVNAYGLTDTPVLEMLALKQFGEEKAAYMPFKRRDLDTLDSETSLYRFVLKEFKNIRDLTRSINAAFVRFVDYGNIYLIESNKKIDDELMGMLLSLEAGGYLLPLIYAHRYAEIKKKELKKIITNLISAMTDPKYRLLLKKGRDVFED